MFQKLFFRLLLTCVHHDMSFGILEKPSWQNFQVAKNVFPKNLFLSETK
jgi:hypothetical protein